MKKIILTLVAAALIPPAAAQTVMSRGRAPTPTPPTPLPESAGKQADEQAAGDYAPMDRTTFGGQIQPAWNSASTREGAAVFRECGDCTYKVRTRQFMTTTVILPDHVTIEKADVGDRTAFRAKVRGRNLLAIRPVGAGVDTNINVYTTFGDVFSLYVRAEGFNSQHVPDLRVRILADRNGMIEGWKRQKKEGEKEDGDKEKTAPRLSPDRRSDSTTLGKNLPFDPSKLHGWGNYKLWGNDELRPYIVFRDDHFTYIQYGDRWNEIELPTAYVVFDGIDELVNTRVMGRTLVVESTAPLISLKSGEKFLCLEYRG